jgi:hypothetical protein
MGIVDRRSPGRKALAVLWLPALVAVVFVVAWVLRAVL